MSFSTSIHSMGLISVLVVIVLLAAGVLWIYNRLVFARNRQQEAWSGVEVQLKKRHDLVPLLVECVRAYRAHEADTFVTTTQARAGNEAEFVRNFRSLLAVAEAYPELKAGERFHDLITQLTRIEEDLQYARRYYNGAVRDFRNLAESFPSNLVARAFGFHPGDFFEVENVLEKNAPSVGDVSK